MKIQLNNEESPIHAVYVYDHHRIYVSLISCLASSTIPLLHCLWWMITTSGMQCIYSLNANATQLL